MTAGINKQDHNVTDWIIAVSIAVIRFFPAEVIRTIPNKVSLPIPMLPRANKVLMKCSPISEIEMNLPLKRMIQDGEVEILEESTEVNLVKNHFFYSVIREMGSIQKSFLFTQF